MDGLAPNPSVSLKCTRANQSCLDWRAACLGSGGVALEAGTDGPQVPVGVEARVVSIGPQELGGVVTHWHVVDGFNILRHGIGIQPGVTRHLIDTIGARAAKPKESVRIGTPMAVIPYDDDGCVPQGDFLG